MQQIPAVMSAEERVLSLFDTWWFEQRVFSLSEPEIRPPPPALLLRGEDLDSGEPKLNRIGTLMRKSHSDNLLSSKDFSSESPNSVLGPHLQTILSGKEVESFNDGSSSPEAEKVSSGEVNAVDSKLDRLSSKAAAAEVDRDGRRRRRVRRRKSESKSLSELEFQEVKGFMDLGFVFSDEDKDSRLVSILPGLQRLGRNNVEGSEGVEETTTSVSRPYLSEAWDFGGDEERVKNPLMDWRIPSFGNEMEFKDHLKFWAHTVASTVR